MYSLEVEEGVVWEEIAIGRRSGVVVDEERVLGGKELT